MSLSRRELLLAGASVPFLTACATDLSQYSDEPLPVLATRLGVCAASHVTLNAGRPGAPVQVSGCTSASPFHSDPVFQAASLTKPVIAFAALKLVRDGRLDLRAPVSHYLPEGYAHRQKPFNGPNDNPIDQVPASTLAHIPVGSLLNHSSGLPNWTRGALSPGDDYSGIAARTATGARGLGLAPLLPETCNASASEAAKAVLKKKFFIVF